MPSRRLALATILLTGCTGLLTACTGMVSEGDGGARIDAAPDAPRLDTGAALDAPVPADAPLDAGPPPCSATALCEPFDGYTETDLVDGQTFGPWRASLMSAGASMNLDGAHTVSGERALHVRIESGATAGGRLYADSTLPLLTDAPTHVYGRMMMYVEPSGTSIHWTFFGVEGPAEPSSPAAGRYAAYIMSSLPRSGVNTYSFVDGLGGAGEYQDCWSQGMTPMPVGRWSCVSFEMDSVARRLRMYVDGGATPIVSVDDTGQGCVDPVPGDSLWYGPAIEDLFVGTWSFHPMDAPLEVWIDDLVVDTAPVACP